MIYETHEYKGYKIEIHRDDDPLNPRTDHDNAGTMCCEHRRYDLGDGGIRLLYDALCEDPRYNDLYLSLPDDEREPFEDDDIPKMLEQAEKWGYTVLPLYLYDHSGITMSCAPFSCPWDSGQVGVIFMSPQTAAKEGIKDPAGSLKGEVEVYDQYLTGDVYGYIVKDDEGEELDSCWGFFGDEEYVKKEAESIVEWYVKRDGEQLEMKI